MAQPTLTAMPATARAGDTLLFEIALADYPASASWAVTYTFRASGGSDVTFTSEANGDNHLFNVPATTTLQWTAGTYYGQARVTDGTNAVTFWEGSLEILPDLSVQDVNFSALPWYFTARDSLQGVISGKVSKDVVSCTIAGQSVSRMSMTEIREAYAWINALCKAYDDQKRAEANGGAGSMVLTRFVNPT